jgi:hypothetical protein
VNIIWSRREGVNRAIIEGMFADVPCIVREGFNYGFRYPYINEHTGLFATEAGLPDAILSIIDRPKPMRPREWVMAHMSCEQATDILGACIRQHADSLGERWTENLAVHFSSLHTLSYQDEPACRARFEPDYQFLRSQMRSHDTEHVPSN